MDALEAAEKKALQKTAEAMGQLKFNAAGGNVDPDGFNKAVKAAQEAGEKEFRKATAAVVADVLTVLWWEGRSPRLSGEGFSVDKP